MSNLRKRKRSLTPTSPPPVTQEETESEEKSDDVLAVGNKFTAALNILNILVGVTIAVFIGVKYALYARQLHENDMWFSNIGVSKMYGDRDIINIDHLICRYSCSLVLTYSLHLHRVCKLKETERLIMKNIDQHKTKI